MNLYLRLLRVLISALLWRRKNEAWSYPGAVSTLWFRVWPQDCDINGHMTHSRYGALSDLGRLDWAIRIGLGSTVKRNRWAPMAAGIHLEFRRELKPFEKFRMETRVLGWRGTNILAEHLYIVTRKGEDVLATRALARVGFYDRSQNRFVQGNELAQLIGYRNPSPDLNDVEETFLMARLTRKAAAQHHPA